MNAKRPYPLYQTNSPLLADPIQLDIFKGKPFYCWDTEFLEKRDRCFNHMIGLPKKDGITKPLFPYEKDVYDAWQNNQHL